MESVLQHIVHQLSKLTDDSNLSTETELERNCEALSIVTSTKQFMIEQGMLKPWLSEALHEKQVKDAVEEFDDEAVEIHEILTSLPQFDETKDQTLRESRFKIFKKQPTSIV